MEKYVTITWPEIQELMEKEGFDENAHLINDETGLDRFGSCAYFVRLDWLNESTDNAHKEKFYLLTALIERSDNVSDSHALFSCLYKAKEAMAQKIAECQALFTEKGELILDLPRCQEWRDEDGNGYTVTIEEMTPIE
ncbi:MAG: hypothetical protein LIP03_14100 [Bacteroidales bacterium]|nr:hypothetical protein [Bacteroidales bacterium]